MTGAEWLRRRMAAGKPPLTPYAGALLANAMDVLDGPVLTPQDNQAAAVRTAADEAVEAYYAAVRAPWVPDDTATLPRTLTQSKRVESAFERDCACPVCAYRYSRCYCPAGAS